MAIQFNCPYCTVTIQVPDNAAGKKGTCPQCGTKVLVPTPKNSPPQSAVPSPSPTFSPPPAAPMFAPQPTIPMAGYPAPGMPFGFDPNQPTQVLPGYASPFVFTQPPPFVQVDAPVLKVWRKEIAGKNAHVASVLYQIARPHFRALPRPHQHADDRGPCEGAGQRAFRRLRKWASRRGRKVCHGVARTAVYFSAEPGGRARAVSDRSRRFFSAFHRPPCSRRPQF